MIIKKNREPKVFRLKIPLSFIINSVIMKSNAKLREIPIWENKSQSKLKGEKWKLIPGYGLKYWVSNLGRVRKFKRTIKSQSFSLGYLVTVLTNDSGSKLLGVHQLVAMAFLNHNTDVRSIVVNHKNGVRCDNNLKNLEVVTQRENILHAIEIGLHDPAYWKGKEIGPNPTRISVNHKLDGRVVEYNSIKDFCRKNEGFIYHRVISDSIGKTNHYSDCEITRC